MLHHRVLEKSVSHGVVVHAKLRDHGVCLHEQLTRGIFGCSVAWCFITLSTAAWFTSHKAKPTSPPPGCLYLEIRLLSYSGHN